MSIIDWFANNKKLRATSPKLNIPSDLWVKCFSCSGILYLKELESNYKVCKECNYHFRLSPEERLSYTFDPESFTEIDADLEPKDILNFHDTESYKSRIKKAQKKANRTEGVLIGTAKLDGTLVNTAIMDFLFMGGSMGSVVGEKVTRIIELATQNKHPLIIFTASGGARMQEGILSLMQMAKTSAALSKLAEANVPYIVVLSDPTTGGTSASFAMLGDVMLAEPGALISFAGPRVIEQTVREKLPDGFQRSEFLLEHGMLDMVVERQDMRGMLTRLVSLLS